MTLLGSATMTELLTTRELQELLCVDRKTIYRMLKDGRLPALRVGGQWRFARQSIEEWLLHSDPVKQAVPQAPLEINTDVLPLDCFTSIQEVFAQAVEIGAVTTDLAGKPLTPISNSCEFCNLILATEAGRRRCQQSWARLSQTPPAPRLERCHAGLTYARARIRVGDEFIAMVFNGQFVTTTAERARLQVNAQDLAAACEIPPGQLRAAAKKIRLVRRARAEKILKLLQQVADTFSQIGERRLDLLTRLRQVSKLATV